MSKFWLQGRCKNKEEEKEGMELRPQRKTDQLKVGLGQDRVIAVILG